MIFENYIKALPILHTWDQGKNWNTGGFDAYHLKELYALIKTIPDGARIIETGAGNSTITFLFTNPKRLVSIAPDALLFERICKYCKENQINVDALELVLDTSELALPRISLEGNSEFDVGLIDGCHGWPTVFVDFCYINSMLCKGSFLLVDDIHLHSVKEFVRYLSRQNEFELRLNLTKLLVFEKLTNERFINGWVGQPYIYERTKADEATGQPFTLKNHARN